MSMEMLERGEAFQVDGPPPSKLEVQRIFLQAMQRVYAWMFLGLLTTTATALLTLTVPAVVNFVFSNSFVFFGLLVGELILVIAISRVAARLSPTLAIALFFLYAALNGVTMSVIFLAYDLGTVWLAFGSTAVLFGVMSVVGYTTKQDLSRWRNVLFIGLIGVIIGSVANFFLANSFFDWIITFAGIALFLGLTIYDTNRIKLMAQAAATNPGDPTVVSRIGVLGALRLYLDFINLFLFILRLLGRRR